MTPRPGQLALDFAVPDHTGTVRRSEDWVGRWLLLVFHRHLG